MSSKISPAPHTKSSQIFMIHDKKRKQNGNIEYLVEFKGSDAQFWESDQELRLVEQNAHRMEAFDIYLEEEKQSNHMSLGKKKPMLEMGDKSKSKGIKKQKNRAKEEHRKKQPKQVHEISSDSQMSESSRYSSSSNLSSKSESPNKKQISKQEVSKRPKVTVILPENKCKITQAMFHSKTKIMFKSKSANGTFEWVQGDEMKKRNPIALIRFYEKKISWK